MCRGAGGQKLESANVQTLTTKKGPHTEGLDLVHHEPAKHIACALQHSTNHSTQRSPRDSLAQPCSQRLPRHTYCQQQD